MIDATYLLARATACDLRAVTDAKGRTSRLFILEGLVGDYTGMAVVPDSLLKAICTLETRVLMLTGGQNRCKTEE